MRWICLTRHESWIKAILVTTDSLRCLYNNIIGEWCMYLLLVALSLSSKFRIESSKISEIIPLHSTMIAVASHRDLCVDQKRKPRQFNVASSLSPMTEKSYTIWWKWWNVSDAPFTTNWPCGSSETPNDTERWKSIWHLRLMFRSSSPWLSHLIGPTI